jgi:hypothetical protein
VEDMMTDLFAHQFFENPKSAEEFEDEDFDMTAELDALEAEAEAAAMIGNEADWEDL